MQEIEPINCVAIPNGYTYHFDLDCAVEDPSQFSDFFTILREASSEDFVFLHINSPGGCLDTTVQIKGAIDETQATVVTCAEGLVASGAAIIFFSGDAFKIADHCEFLIHTASGGSLGKISDNLSAVRFQVKRMQKLYEDVLGGLLTEEELASVARGEEFYMDSENVRERIQNAIEEGDTEE